MRLLWRVSDVMQVNRESGTEILTNFFIPSLSPSLAVSAGHIIHRCLRKLTLSVTQPHSTAVSSRNLTHMRESIYFVYWDAVASCWSYAIYERKSLMHWFIHAANG